MINKIVVSLVILSFLIGGCTPQAAGSSANLQPVSKPIIQAVQQQSPGLTSPQPTKVIPASVPGSISDDNNSADVAETGPASQPTAVGPDQFPSGTNPLTGLPVSDPSTLQLPPALVSVTNFPVSARPQAGLSFSPIVFELYIGEGMSRFLAMFYGDFPQKAAAAGTSTTGLTSADADIGPIRSGRLPYESIRKLYNGFLVMASAWKGVAANLSQFSNVFGSDTSNINSAMINVTQLSSIAQANAKRLGDTALNGMEFDSQPVSGGKTANNIWMMWSMADQVFWRYDPTSGAYLRWQDNADGKTYTQATDRLTGKPLAFDNVVFLYANHRECTEAAFQVDLMYVSKMKAEIFRDGKMYDAYWTTASGQYEVQTGKLRPIRFIDANGNPFPLKPGQTWVEIVPPGTPSWETVNSTNYLDMLNQKQPGSGNWAFRFFASQMVMDQKVCDQIRNQ
ncbi:MAG: DUF3048 C-terminal domain-containing protein [Anaerolineaceae bacterium]|nr:DUF3048 C-terminal domain-containing protein [Anaerolineaceae bacterium]